MCIINVSGNGSLTFVKSPLYGRAAMTDYKENEPTEPHPADQNVILCGDGYAFIDHDGDDL